MAFYSFGTPNPASFPDRSWYMEISGASPHDITGYGGQTIYQTAPNGALFAWSGLFDNVNPFPAIAYQNPANVLAGVFSSPPSTPTGIFGAPFEDVDDHIYVTFSPTWTGSPALGIIHEDMRDGEWMGITFNLPPGWSVFGAGLPGSLPFVVPTSTTTSLIGLDQNPGLYVPPSSYQTFGTGAGIIIYDDTGGSIDYSLLWFNQINFNVTPICFCDGVKIRMADGEDVLIEDLTVGDMVMTKEGTARPIRWLGKTSLDKARLTAQREIRPIKIEAGALGNSEEMRVSPNHCFLLSGPLIEARFDEAEALAPAKSLVNDKTITIDHSLEPINYYHIMLDTHDVIMANGIWSESLFLGDFIAGAMDPVHLEEIEMIFPELVVDGPSAIHAHRTAPILTPNEVEFLV